MVRGQITILSLPDFFFLQTPQLNFSMAATLVDYLVDTLNSERDDSHFKEIWDKTVTCATALQHQCCTSRSSRMSGHTSLGLEEY